MCIRKKKKLTIHKGKITEQRDKKKKQNRNNTNQEP